MTYTPASLLTAYYDGEARRKVGRLAVVNRQIVFEYDPQFLFSGIEISPFKLTLKPGVSACPDAVFDGLYGVFNDSLPDGWGRLLLDRSVERHGIDRRQLNALDRLAYVGSRGMGALSYEPDHSDSADTDSPLALDRLARQTAVVLAGEHEEVFEELLRLSGSSAGARPKIVAQVNADKSAIIHGQEGLQRGFEHWMIKFASTQDPRDVGAVEYAYSLMAKDGGIDMRETHLFRTKKRAYFGTRRFDRVADRRVHVHSLSGLIHADHRVPSLDYDTVLRVVLLLTKSMVEVEKVFALTCFNVLAHNRDDHAKNFSFMLTDRHEWAFAPAYNLTFSYGPGGEQSTMVLGEGLRPHAGHLLALGKRHALKKAPKILERVREAVARWRVHAKEAGVSARSAGAIAKHLSHEKKSSST